MPGENSATTGLKHPSSVVIARILPFAIYLAFLGLQELFDWISGGSQESSFHLPGVDLWLYPVQVGAVLVALVMFWPRYQELRGVARSLRLGEVGVGIVVGLLVYAAWVRMDWAWATQGDIPGYNPFQGGAGQALVLVPFRLAGAALIVPIMEELFWRSFLLRYIISARFDQIPLGTFTWGSFLISVVLFGLEHHYWLAGILAGVAYTLLLYWSRRLWVCILSHAVTNLALGIHVLLTHQWHWW